jgi:O-antigen/teichoic acid export membrane protein
MTSIHRSLFFSGLDRYGSLLLFLVSTAALSRLLTPAEFGLYAMTNAVVAVIISSFQEFGGANYLIQKKVLLADDIRTAFTITLLLSVLLGVLLFSSRSAFAWFFRQDGLKASIAVSTLTFVVMPFSAVISALFRRNMEFGKLAICSLSANAIATIVAIVLAVSHYSFMAPVWGGVAGNSVLALLLIGLCKNRTVFRFSLSGYRDVMRFGLYSGGVSIINVFYSLAPPLFLGRILDFTAVGLYSRAANIAQVFDGLVGRVLSPVIMPAIVSEHRAGSDLKPIYLEAMALLSVVHWPFLAFLAIMAQPIVLLWLGTTWLDVVPLARVLCLGYLALFVACLTYPVLVAVGSVRDALVASVISLPPSLLVVFGASFVGVWAVAASAMLTLPFQTAVAIYFVGRHLRITPLDVFNATLKSAIVTVSSSTAAAAFAVMAKYGMMSPALALILACISALICWLLVVIVTGHPVLPRLQVPATHLCRYMRVPAYISRDTIR